MIFPVPVTEEYKEGYYQLTETVREESLLAFYESVKAGNKDISYEYAAPLQEEAYEIRIGERGVLICCAGETGKFRALTSLRQLLTETADGDRVLPLGRIEDHPQFERRGYMLDISRCRMPKVETLTWLIDLLADLKYNELQLYMDSFCFKYDAFPEVTADFDCLTPEDIEYLDQYCADRFIDLVPNQNSFGHMAAWLAKPELAHLGLTDGTVRANTLNPLLDCTGCSSIICTSRSVCTALPCAV